MKKIILLLVVAFSISCKAQTGVAVASLQTQGNNTLTIVKKQQDTSNSYQRILAKTTAFTISTLVITPGSGTIGAGANKMEFLTSSDFTGSINGTSFLPSLYIPFGGLNYRTLPAINYVVTTGNLTVIVTQ